MTDHPEETSSISINKITNPGDGTINIAGHDIHQTVLPTQAAEARERRALQEQNLAAAAQEYAAAQDRLRVELVNPLPPPMPYKGLHYFDPSDQAIFFGRQEIAQELVDRIVQPQHRLTVLHAPSGAGKTSLIRAGLTPPLLKRGCCCVLCTPLPYPTSIYAPFTDLAPAIPDFTDLPLRDFLGLALKNICLPAGGKLVLFIDQFERLFNQETQTALLAVERDLAACLRAEEAALPLRVVIAIRSDFLWALDQMRTSIPEVLDHRLLLPPLTHEQALQAIMEPLNGWPVSWQPEAAQSVLAYLAKGEIEPPHLQLICTQLFERATRLGQAFITSADVAEHDLAALHRQYLRSELSLLPDEELGWDLLKRLINSQGVSLPQLWDALAETQKGIAEALVERRVLRRTKIPQGMRIEIAHETLAHEILARESRLELRIKTAQELIQRGLEDWQRHQTLIDLLRLRILDEYQDVMGLLFDREEFRQAWKEATLEFLLRSAVQQGHAVPFWYSLALQRGLDADAVVLEGLKVESFRSRSTIVSALGGLGEKFIPALCEMLADDYPQVRMAVIKALEKLQPTGEWRAHLMYECYVPAGEFTMGDNRGNTDERPAHKVHLDAFYTDKYPVTNADYARYFQDLHRTFQVPEGKENHPVVIVSWYDARDYAAWAGMRLLTEAEWEKAARGTQKRLYPWGNEWNSSYCNSIDGGPGDTTPVGRYSPKGDSPYGVADMAGNVLEWCSSKKDSYPYQAEDGRENLDDTARRALRGGSFHLDASFARCSSRFETSRNYRSNYYGFRVGQVFLPQSR